jgi:sugar lactone lactonase YvrE
MSGPFSRFAAARIGFSALFAVASGVAWAAPADVTLPGDHAFPESITTTGDGTMFISNIAGGGVLKVKPGASMAEPFIAPGAYDTRSTFGVLADEKTKTLWVCSNDATVIGLPGPSKVEGAYLKGFDLATGEGKISAKLPGKAAICNDMAIAADGTLYLTNTLAPQILDLKPGAKDLAIWAEDPALAPAGGAGLDGIAFGGDGNIYVNKFASGDLLRVDMHDGKAGAVTKLTTSKPLTFPDGLRPISGQSCLMAEGGGRLDRITVDGDKATVDVIKDGFVQPTGVSLQGNIAWVADGQLSRLKGTAPTLPFKVYAIPLSGTAQ